MEVPVPPPDDVLAFPARARLFATLVELRRPATTAELAALIGRHANTTRAQLQRMAEAGLVECRRAPQRRGRPRHEWVIAPDAMPAGQAPEAHGQLAQWLARAMAASGTSLDDVEEAGRAIGAELAPDRSDQPVAAAMADVLTALGFAPRREPGAGEGRVRYVLGNCPYREAVRENQPVVCTLHRGITRGVLARLDPEAELVGFVARDPFAAGCLIDVAT